ncbi:MAG: hemin ABC transporter ATP-binding protein, partial [Lactococcus lactis]
MKTILKMENVKKSFGSGHNEIQALKGIDLAVNQGEFVSIIGPSGSG